MKKHFLYLISVLSLTIFSCVKEFPDNEFDSLGPQVTSEDTLQSEYFISVEYKDTIAEVEASIEKAP